MIPRRYIYTHSTLEETIKCAATYLLSKPSPLPRDDCIGSSPSAFSTSTHTYASNVMYIRIRLSRSTDREGGMDEKTFALLCLITRGDEGGRIHSGMRVLARACCRNEVVNYERGKCRGRKIQSKFSFSLLSFLDVYRYVPAGDLVLRRCFSTTYISPMRLGRVSD